MVMAGEKKELVDWKSCFSFATASFVPVESNVCGAQQQL